MSAAPPLKQLGRYELKRVLGKGAMGVVYEGLDPRLNRTVAVKTILKSQLLDAETAADYSARFVREAQAVARLNHPNIVTVFDFGEENDVAYIVMEYIRGRELKDYFDENQFFDLREALRIMCELLDALEFAHRQGIIHRDIKPANLMLDAGGRVKLTDFGVARLADTGHDRTVAGTMVGTPSYMSPEQIQGNPVGPRADLFAAGVILYQFLTHEKPFTGQGQWTIQKKIVQEDPAPPSFVNQAVPAVFDGIISRALAKNADDRYPSAEAFAADLKRVLAGENLGDEDATCIAPARAPGAGGRPGESSVPPRSPAAAATAAEPPHWAQATVALQEPVAPQPAPSRPAAREAAPPSPPPAPPRVEPAAPAPPPAAAPAPKSKLPLVAGGAAAVVVIAAGAWLTLRPGASPPVATPAATAPPATVAKVDPNAGQAPTPPAADAETLRQQRLEDELRRREEEAQRQAEEAARRRIEDEERRKAEEAARRIEEAARRQAEDEARQRAAEDARRKTDEAAKRKLELEAKRRADEEAAKLQAQQEAQRKAEEEARRKAAEDEARRKAQEDARRKAEEDARKKAADEEARKKAADEEARRRAAEEAKRKAEEEKKRLTPAELIAQAAQLEGSGKVAAAVRLYRQAANAGSGEAAKKLGDIYGKGSGDVGRDYAESVKWYGVAAERGVDVPLPGRR